MDRVLVCVDFSGITPRTIEVAASLLASEGGRITVLHVAPPDPAYVGFEAGPQTQRDAIARERRAEHREVQALAEDLEQRGLDAKALLVQGPTVEKILQEADRLDADAIVLGSHGHGALYDILVGSVARGVIRESRRPVLLVPAGDEGGP